MNTMAGPGYRDVDDEFDDWLDMDPGQQRRPVPVVKTLLIHKADNGPRAIFNDPDDVTINITGLGSEPAYQAEGIGLADALWGTLPAITIDALMKRLGELSEATNE